MRILIVTGIYPPDIGGPATYIPQLARALVLRGHNVTVMTLGEDTLGPSEIAEWEVVRVSREIPLTRRIFIVMKRIHQLSRIHDVIFANGLYIETGLVLRFVKKRSIAKIVGDPIWERATNRARTNLLISEFNSNLGMDIWSTMQRKLLGFSLNSFCEVSCPSAELEKYIKSWGVHREISVIANGVKLSPCPPRLKKYDVISVSRLVKWKNLDKLISACAQVRLKLAIVGSGPEMENLMNVAYRKNADVEFLGELIGDDVSSALCSAKVFAGISSYEGLSFSLIQAMGSGLPVVASNIPGNSDVVTDQHDGVLLDINDINLLSEVLLSLVSDETYADRLGKAALATVASRFSLETQLNQMIIRIER